MNDERFESLERRVDAVEKWQKEAVPNGDHVGHCRYHALMIEEIEDRKRLIRAIKEKSIAGLVWGTLAFLGFASWTYLKSLIKG